MCYVSLSKTNYYLMLLLIHVGELLLKGFKVLYEKTVVPCHLFRLPNLHIRLVSYDWEHLA